MTLPRVLVVDDDAELTGRLAELLGPTSYSVRCENAPEAALRHALDVTPDVALIDVRMPGMNGLELLERLRLTVPTLPAILMTGDAAIEDAVAAMRAGAFDYIEKPFRSARVVELVERALETTRAVREADELRDELAGLERPFVLGTSPAMERVCEEIRRVARTNATTVLVRGESGTGKELVARAIHHASNRADHPFVAVNCSAFHENLLGSELFGYEGGAFTGADSRGRPGLFREADGGTILLDEIGEMPLPLQPVLLRTLQERTARPVGGTRDIPVDVRLIAATHRDLEREMQEGTFRQDLYYRLNVMEIVIPPLRERREDILPLARHFVRRLGEEHGREVGGFAPAATDRLLAHPWPGNVRELRNVVEVAVLSTDADVIEERHLRLTSSGGNDVPGGENVLHLPDTRLETAERLLVQLVLERSHGNVSRSARELGINRSTLYAKMKAYQLDARETARAP